MTHVKGAKLLICKMVKGRDDNWAKWLGGERVKGRDGFGQNDDWARRQWGKMGKGNMAKGRYGKGRTGKINWAKWEMVLGKMGRHPSFTQG
jgi:hypothetical protein